MHSPVSFTICGATLVLCLFLRLRLAHCARTAMAFEQRHPSSRSHQLQRRICGKHDEFRPASSSSTALNDMVGSPTDGASDLMADNVDLAALPDSNSNSRKEDFFLSFRKKAPKKLQYFLRDSGLVRAILDGGSILAIPEIQKSYPSALEDFLHLSGGVTGFGKKKSKNRYLPEKVKFERHAYGPDGRQYVELMHPLSDSVPHQKNQQHKRLVAFVHGGGWGSGWPSMYRLLAKPFLKEGYGVAVVGYRTYPDTDLDGQIHDLVMAIESLKRSYPEISQEVTLMGHSTGAHISSLGILRGDLQVDQFIGLSGVYNIPSHYAVERSRGVERMSPLAPICGGSLHQWKANSPDLFFVNNMLNQPIEEFDLPPVLLVHGECDTIVPHASAIRFANALYKSEVFRDKVSLEILPNVGHAETVLHLFFGGATRSAILEWLRAPT